MEYNKRSSSMIQTWMVKFSVKPVFHKVLLSVFESAWREVEHPPHGGPNVLKHCRCYRSRAWWDGIKDLRSERSSQGLVRAIKGYKSEW